MKRRDALVSIAASGAGMLLGACAAPPAPDGDLSDEQLGALLRLAGYQMAPGEGAKILASFKGNRFTTDVDPTIQPQSDFDPDVDPLSP